MELLTGFEHDTVCPAHGPVVPPPKGGGLVQWQLDHRIGRENQVLEALRKGRNSVSDITSDMYPPDLNEKLRPSAENNVTTHLKKLIEDNEAFNKQKEDLKEFKSMMYTDIKNPSEKASKVIRNIIVN